MHPSHAGGMVIVWKWFVYRLSSLIMDMLRITVRMDLLVQKGGGGEKAFMLPSPPQ